MKQPKVTSASVGIAALSIVRKNCVKVATPFIQITLFQKLFNIMMRIFNGIANSQGPSMATYIGVYQGKGKAWRL